MQHINKKLYKSVVPLKNDATKVYSKGSIRQAVDLNNYFIVDGKVINKLDLNLNKGTLKEIPSDYVDKANKKDAILEKIGWQNKAGKPAILQGLARTVGASAAMAAGAAYSTPVAGTLKALAKNIVAGGVGAEGFAMLEGRTATPTELAIGTGMEMVGPIVGNVPGIAKDVAQSFSKENLKTTIDNSMNYLGKVSPKLKENYVNTIKSYDNGILSAEDLMSNEYFIKVNDASKLSSLAEDPSIHPQKIFDAFQNSSLEESDLLHATGISIDDLKLRINEKAKPSIPQEDFINVNGTDRPTRESVINRFQYSRDNNLNFDWRDYSSADLEHLYTPNSGHAFDNELNTWRTNRELERASGQSREALYGSQRQSGLSETEQQALNEFERTRHGSDFDWSRLENPRQARYNERYGNGGTRTTQTSPDLPPPPAEVNINTDGLRNHVSRFNLNHNTLNNLTPEMLENLQRSIMTTRPTIGNSINGMVSSLKSTPSKLGIKVGNLVNQKLRPESNLIPFEKNASHGAESIIPTLFHSGSTNGQVVKKVISSIHNMDKSPAGNYISAGSLSSSSYPMTSKLLSKLDPERYKVVYDGTMGLNGMGYPERFIRNIGGTTEDVAKYINTLNKDVKIDGKTYPKAFVDQNGHLQIPKLVAKKLK